MQVKDAKEIARKWVLEIAAGAPGFHGAYLAGSINWLPEEALLPATSDLDINVVYLDSDRPNERSKFVYGDVLIEVTPLSLDELQPANRVLAHYHLAGGLATSSILMDPSGRLTELQVAVSRGYARPRWVRQRCRHARQRVLKGLATLDEADPFEQQVVSWLFPTGVTAHVLLVAGLRNPTVRDRYTAVRQLLEEHSQIQFYETLLQLLGCERMSRASVESHLSSLEEIFDVATAAIQSPFSFSSDISEIARPLAINGSRDLINRGLYREAVFWIAVTYSRCQTVLAVDAPELRAKFDTGYRQLLADLGIYSFIDLQQRSERVRAHLPRVWRVAEAIMTRAPGIAE